MVDGHYWPVAVLLIRLPILWVHGCEILPISVMVHVEDQISTRVCLRGRGLSACLPMPSRGPLWWQTHVLVRDTTGIRVLGSDRVRRTLLLGETVPLCPVAAVSTDSHRLR